MEEIAVAIIGKLGATQIIIILAVGFLYHLVTKMHNRQNKKMTLRNYVRARVDEEVFEFSKIIDLLKVDSVEKGDIKLHFELLARTYLMDAYMDSVLKNGFCKYNKEKFGIYCKETGIHIRNELIRRLLVYRSKFEYVISILDSDLYDTTYSVKQYSKCAGKYKELCRPFWKREEK
jgi:hypothetical protein